MIWLLAPFDREQFALNVADIWRRQRDCAAGVGLVVVENGGARYDGPCTLKLRIDERNLTLAVYTALEKLRQVGEPSDWVARVDIDDEYGAHYARDIERVQELGDWSGFPQHLCQLQDGRIGLIGTPDTADCTGGTLAARINAWPTMPDPAFENCEDLIWCERAIDAGLRFVPRGPAEYLRVRQPNSVDRTTDGAMMVLVGMLDPCTGSRLQPTAADYAVVADEVFSEEA